MIRLARPEDAYQLIGLARDFCAHSKPFEGIRFSPDNAFTTLQHAIENPSLVVAVSENDGKLDAFTIWGLENPWTHESIALEAVFYVTPERGRKHTGRELLPFAVHQCKAKGAKLGWSSSTAGFDDGGLRARAYNRLLIGEGFEPIPHSAFLFKRL